MRCNHSTCTSTWQGTGTEEVYGDVCSTAGRVTVTGRDTMHNIHDHTHVHDGTGSGLSARQTGPTRRAWEPNMAAPARTRAGDSRACANSFIATIAHTLPHSEPLQTTKGAVRIRVQRVTITQTANMSVHTKRRWVFHRPRASSCWTVVTVIYCDCSTPGRPGPTHRLLPVALASSRSRSPTGLQAASLGRQVREAKPTHA